MTKQGIIFSFIIPTFNRAGIISRTLGSILNSSREDLEIIVVDDGSTDNTESVVSAMGDPRIRYTKIVNSERGAARNKGTQLAQGRYVNFFDSDDLLLPCLDDLYLFLEKENFPAVVYGGIRSGTSVSTDRLPFRSFRENLLHNNFLACGSVFLQLQVALEFPFHEDRRLSSAEDWELWLRVHTKHQFKLFPVAVFEQVQHAGRSLATIDPEKIEIRDCYFAEIIETNRTLSEFYGVPALNLFVADRYTFIALSWCSTNLRRARKFFVRAFFKSPIVMKRKRFWAVAKKMLFL